MLQRPEEGVPLAERPTDADRDRVVAELRRLCADGRLTLDEFSDRVGLVLKARTREELEGVAMTLAPSTMGRTVDLPRKRKTRVLGIMCGGIQRGRWRPGERVKTVAFWGGTHLDFRGAEWSGPVVDIKAVAVMGGIEIVVPEGVRVEVHAVPIMGGVDRRIRDVPVLPGTPVIRVKAVAFWGGVCVRSKPSRRDEERELRATGGRRRPRHGHGHGFPHSHRQDDESLDRIADAVVADPPDLSQDLVTDGTVTLLFSDIEDFTVLTEKLGDWEAQQVLRAHNEIVRAQVAACGGREVKSQGDSFMIAFPGARRALRCAIAVQRAIADWSCDHPDRSLRVRIGLHTGEAIRENDDLFGRSVIMAARIADEAEGAQILVSSLLKELVGTGDEFRFGPPLTAELKGLQGLHELHPVLWE